MSSKTIVRAQNIAKAYTSGPEVLHVLRGLDLAVHPGEFLAVTGVSGSGKSTLLHILGLLDNWDSGQVFFDDQDVATLDGVDVLKKRDSPITVEPGEAARGKKTVDPGKRAESKVTARIKKDLETSEPVPAKTGPKTDFIKNSVQKVKTYLQFCGTSFRNADAYIRGKLPFIKERLNAIPVKVRRDILLLLASFTVIIYVLVCLPLMLVARKLGRKHSWLTWIPLVQCFYFIYMAKNPLWFVVFFLLPVLNIFVLLFLFVDILKLLHKPRWLVLLILLPGVNVFTLWYLAISKAGLPAPSISDTV